MYFPKTRTFSYKNRNAKIKMRKLTLLPYYYLIYRSYSTFPNHPSKVFFYSKNNFFSSSEFNSALNVALSFYVPLLFVMWNGSSASVLWPWDVEKSQAFCGRMFLKLGLSDVFSWPAQVMHFLQEYHRSDTVSFFPQSLRKKMVPICPISGD